MVNLLITIQSTKDKTLWVVTAFLSKKIEAEQFRNAANRPLRYTSKNVAVSTSKDSIRKKDENVKKSLDVDSEGTTLSVEQIKRYKNVASELRDEQGLKAKFYLHEAEIIEAGLPFKTAPQLSVDTVSKSASNSSISNSDENVKKSLDVDTDGNKLSAEQQEYFADSKIRDEDGRLLVVYHGTNYDFNGISNSSMSSFSRTV